ncbi:MAG: PaaI family thioesterase [Candidatus Zixiibacteriota bacterium]
MCGQDNHIGLKARFYYEDGRARTEYTAEKKFEGYHGVFHGGITATLLDEVMIKALLAKEIYAMTVELTVRFHKPVYIGQKLLLSGSLEQQKGRLFITNGEVKTDDGDLVASATGKYLEVRTEMKGKLLESLES